MRTDFFNEAIITAMLAVSVADAGETPPPGPDDGADLARAAALRERIVPLLDRADRVAAQAGMPNDLVEAADFAACAFIDEVLLSSASWPGHVDWLKKPLQFARHGTATAGEDFYRLLDTLLEAAEKKAPVDSLPSWTQDAAAPRHEEAAAHADPLHAVLEIFALCLAQGFVGMYYNDPAVIRGKLDSIGRFVPAVAHRAEPFSFAFAEPKAVKRGLSHKATDMFRRFDPLDCALWIIPPVVTALLYLICETRLDQLLQPFLQGSASL